MTLTDDDINRIADIERNLEVGDVLDVPGAAALLRCGRDAIYTACGRKQIPHRRVGNRIRFSRRALLRWLECNESPTP